MHSKKRVNAALFNPRNLPRARNFAEWIKKCLLLWERTNPRLLSFQREKSDFIQKKKKEKDCVIKCRRNLPKVCFPHFLPFFLSLSRTFHHRERRKIFGNIAGHPSFLPGEEEKTSSSQSLNWWVLLFSARHNFWVLEELGRKESVLLCTFWTLKAGRSLDLFNGWWKDSSEKYWVQGLSAWQKPFLI